MKILSLITEIICKNWLLIVIFGIALFLRTFLLNSVPYGFHADEARASWGAWSILHTGADDWGNKFPLYYDTFGDQRPTGIFYLTAPFLLFGKSVAIARLPAAFFGAISIFAIYWLSLLITKNKSMALLSAFFLAMSPWHIVTSRSGSEVVASGTLILFGMCFLVSGLKKNNTRELILSIALGIASYFFYHTSRILVPIFWLILWWQQGKVVTKNAFLGLILILITLLFFLQPESRGRLMQVSVFSDSEVAQNVLKASAEEGENKVFVTRLFHNKFFWYGKSYAEHYLEYFSGSFLVGENSFPVRYKIPNFGLMTYIDLVFLVSGVLVLLKNKKFSVLGILLLSGPFAAAITIDETPNIHRALYMLYFICILEAIGAFLIHGFLKDKKLLWVLVIFAYTFHWAIFWHNYVVHTEKTTIIFHRDGGTLELAQKINEVKNNYDKTILTDTPSDLTPWIGFTGDWNASEFNSKAKRRKDTAWEIDNLIFSRKRCPSTTVNNIKSNTLLIDAENCPDPVNTKEMKYKFEFEINRPDGSTAYKGWKMQRSE
jgi:4-amino-4-deoxy-L-arabinose transferase-like glycosyltransferase